ncbi:hypothetical protein cyc_08482 [Cyclospora cayetanensis]|uniref:Uncharacterized protein n=1 Tax=Cyclospora cayetanensis TaxID=88456 RepID=A0A1D3CT38_9EIME|nr:hypothetical protein cyc_08482 [Cyclospora cayetanensis]
MAKGIGDMADQMRFGVTGLTVEVDPVEDDEDDGIIVPLPLNITLPEYKELNMQVSLEAACGRTSRS